MQLACVFFTQYMALWCVINSHGLLACTSVLDWYGSEIWVPIFDSPALIAHLIPNSDQSHNMYLECFLMKINNCHLHCWRQGFTSAAVRLACLRNKGGTVKSNSIKASLWKPRYFIQLQISNNHAQTLASRVGERCGGAGFEN